MKVWFGILAVCLMLSGTAFGQFVDGTEFVPPPYLGITDQGIATLNVASPMLLAKTDGDDREQKADVLGNGTAIVYWVDRGGSHQFSGMKPDGSQIYPTFLDRSQPDIILGQNTGGNTNWTLCKASLAGDRFLIASTWKISDLPLSIQIPATVGDDAGVKEDDGQGHGFFRIFDSNLNAITPAAKSISQRSLGHREWDVAPLSNGGWVITVVSQAHTWNDAPGAELAKSSFVNILNADGTHAKPEFIPKVTAAQGQIVEDASGSRGDTLACSLPEGFALVLRSADTPKAIIYDNNGNVLNSFPVVESETLGVAPSLQWGDGGGASTFVLVYTVTLTQALIDAGLVAPDGAEYLAEDYIGVNVLLARLFNANGPASDYIFCGSGDLTSIGRPRVSVAQNGSFTVTWTNQDSGDDGAKHPVFRVFTSNGTPATPPTLFHNVPEFMDGATALTGNSDGEPISGMNDDAIVFAWGTYVWSGNRDTAANIIANPAKPQAVRDWELY